MATPLDLSNVSPDIKRLVLGMVENSIEEVRKASFCIVFFSPPHASQLKEVFSMNIWLTEFSM